MPVVYLNGKYLPDDQALIPVLDRGFIFGDGVYEVIPVYWGKPFRMEQHLARLRNSLRAIRMDDPLPEPAWQAAIAALLTHNPVTDSMSIYLQVTRGPARRDHAIPKTVTPTVFMMANPIAPTDPAWLAQGVGVVTLDDIRWNNCHIKAITLLPNVLLRQDAADRNAVDAILLRDGHLTEGTASNVFVVKNGALATPPNSNEVLPGITRDVVLELARKHGIPAGERVIAAAELETADEIWLTSSTKEVLPVTRLNDRPVGNGKPGPLWRRMYEHYQDFKRALRTAP